MAVLYYNLQQRGLELELGCNYFEGQILQPLETKTTSGYLFDLILKKETDVVYYCTSIAKLMTFSSVFFLICFSWISH